VTHPAPGPEFPDDYFRTGNYADRPLGRFSMYWFARRYFAALIRRHAPRGGADRPLVELGCGLGHLLGLLQDEFRCTGLDLLPVAIEATRREAPRAEAVLGDARDLGRFDDTSLAVVVALHVVEHLHDPRGTLQEVFRCLRPGGLFLFATPHPDYLLRRFKDRARDAIGKDPTHVNCHPPPVWKAWCGSAGFVVKRHFGDGLWDVPYVPLFPASLQLAVLGLPAFVQVVTRTTFMPLTLGVNQITIARKPEDRRPRR
jgi:SAM-dependent methyltransferase